MGLGFGGGSAGPDSAQTTGSAGPLSGPQPLHTLAMAKDEVKARLAPIPVYTVANPKNEFVLVAGEVRRGCGREGWVGLGHPELLLGALLDAPCRLSAQDGTARHHVESFTCGVLN